MSSSFNNLNSDLDNINDNINHHCSFCGNIGHDIRFCDSPDIPSIEHTIANIYVSNLQESIILELNNFLDNKNVQFNHIFRSKV